MIRDTVENAPPRRSPRRARLVLAVAVATAVAALLAGYFLFDSARLMYMRRVIGPKVIDIVKYQGIDGYTDTSRKEPAHPAVSPKDAYCFLVFGQSNVANSGNSAFQPTHTLYTIHKGAIYKATAPLLGADGNGSNPALEALDLFAAHHPDKTIYILSIAISGSSVFHWAKTGELHHRLVEAVAEAKKLGLPITHVIYHQGEADCAIDTPPDYYKAALKSLLGDVRALGVDAPIFLGNASLHKRFDCPDVANPACYVDCPKIVAAQRQIAREMKNVFPGVNSDVVVPWPYRYDGYHFDAQGQSRFAVELDRILEEHTQR